MTSNMWLKFKLQYTGCYPKWQVCRCHGDVSHHKPDYELWIMKDVGDTVEAGIFIFNMKNEHITKYARDGNKNGHIHFHTKFGSKATKRIIKTVIETYSSACSTLLEIFFWKRNRQVKPKL